MGVERSLPEPINRDVVSGQKNKALTVAREQVSDRKQVVETRLSRHLPSEEKDLVAVILLNVVIPGAGHIYLGRRVTGTVLLFCALLAWMLNFTIVGVIVGAPALVCLTILSVCTGCMTCSRINRDIASREGRRGINESS